MSRKKRRPSRDSSRRGQPAEPAPEPRPNWTWGDAYNRYEATLDTSTIGWLWIGPKDLGGGADQDIAEFLAFGPLDKDAPPHVTAGLKKAIETRPNWQDWREAAQALIDGKLREAAGQAERDHAAAERHREIRSWKDPWRSYEATADTGQNTRRVQRSTAGREGKAEANSSPRSISSDASAQSRSTGNAGLLCDDALRGFILIFLGTAVPLAITPFMPLLGGYLTLFLPVVGGLAAPFVRLGGASLVVAGFFGMAGAIGAHFYFSRYLDIARGEAVTLASIAEAPAHPAATHILTADARVIRSLAGEVDYTTTSNVGYSRGQETRWTARAAPLVFEGWERSAPVPAWLACTSGPFLNCLAEMDKGAKHFRTVRAEELPRYRQAASRAAARFGLQASPGAPILEIAAGDAAQDRTRFALYAAGLPLLAFIVWFCGLAGWRFLRRGRE